MADYIEGARVYHDAAQTVPMESYMTLAFNSERWDTDGIHDPVTNNSRLTCRTAGKYLVACQAHFEQGGVCCRKIAIRLNSALLISPPQEFPTAWDRNPDGPTRLALQAVMNLKVNDFIELLVMNGDWVEPLGYDILAETCTTPEFMMHRIGPAGIENFHATLSGLKPDTTYHFRAKATNAAGTSYGVDKTFTTAGGEGERTASMAAKLLSAKENLI